MDEKEAEERVARGERLRQAREQKREAEGGGWTLEYVGGLIGRTKGAIGHWETGVSMPPYRLLIQLCRLYEVPVEYVLYGTKPGSADIDFRTVAYMHASQYSDPALRSALRRFLDEVTDLTRSVSGPSA